MAKYKVGDRIIRYNAERSMEVIGVVKDYYVVQQDGYAMPGLLTIKSIDENNKISLMPIIIRIGSSWINSNDAHFEVTVIGKFNHKAEEYIVTEASSSYHVTVMTRTWFLDNFKDHL